MTCTVCFDVCQLDGLIARNFANQTSALGSIIDPLADKLLVSVLYVTLTYVHLLPCMLSSLISFSLINIINVYCVLASEIWHKWSNTPSIKV